MDNWDEFINSNENLEKQTLDNANSENTAINLNQPQNVASQVLKNSDLEQTDGNEPVNSIKILDVEMADDSSSNIATKNSMQTDSDLAIVNRESEGDVQLLSDPSNVVEIQNGFETQDTEVVDDSIQQQSINDDVDENTENEFILCGKQSSDKKNVTTAVGVNIPKSEKQSSINIKERFKEFFENKTCRVVIDRMKEETFQKYVRLTKSKENKICVVSVDRLKKEILQKYASPPTPKRSSNKSVNKKSDDCVTDGKKTNDQNKTVEPIEDCVIIGVAKKRRVLQETSECVICAECNKVFASVKQLTKHISNCTKPKHECYVCHELYVKIVDLEVHLGKNHTEEFQVCKNCWKIFNSLPHYIRHQCNETDTVVYDVKKPNIVCGVCSKNFPTIVVFHEHYIKSH